MRVICVKRSSVWPIAQTLAGGNMPDVGDECTVLLTRRCGCGQHDVYELEGYWIATGFHVHCFAIMPSPDGDEINDREKESIVPPPTKS